MQMTVAYTAFDQENSDIGILSYKYFMTVKSTFVFKDRGSVSKGKKVEQPYHR